MGGCTINNENGNASEGSAVDRIKDIIAEYARMRQNGLDAKVALNALRIYVEPLSKKDRDDLIGYLRRWEAGERDIPDPNTKVATGTMPAIKGIKPKPASSPDAPPLPEEDATVPNQYAPPPVIRKITAPPPPTAASKDLGELQGKFDTHLLVDESTRVSEDYFGKDSVLLLLVRGSDQAFEVRPQQYIHDIVVGRSSAQSAMRPDVDLEPLGAAEQGVSRLHLAMRYDAGHNAIHFYDLGSSNGSYVNNQRLHPHEVRFLRDGDQLRLGRMVIIARFKHAR
jgi:hypothetical protein